MPTRFDLGWVTDGMTSHVHVFEPQEGGDIRISLTYDEPTDAGKTSAQTDTFQGQFTRLVPDAKSSTSSSSRPLTQRRKVR